MGQRHRDLTLAWQAALAAVDGQDTEKSLAEQLGVELIGNKRRQQEWDNMRRRMRYLSIAQMLPGNSQFKDGAMALLSPDNGDLYTAAWDDSAAWQATILPMEEKLDRFIASQPPGMDDITAIQLLHQKEAEYNDMAEAHGAALDKRGGIATALSEWSVMKAWQETMPNASHEQYDSAWAPGLEPFVMMNDLDGLSRTKRERLQEAFEAAGLDEMFPVTETGGDTSWVPPSSVMVGAAGLGAPSPSVGAQGERVQRPAELEEVLTGTDSKSTFPLINMLRRVEQEDPRKVAIFLNYLAVNKHPDQSDSEIARDDVVEKRPVNPRIASAKDARRIARDLRVEKAFIDPSVVDELEAELAVTDPRDYPRDPKRAEDVALEAEADAHVAGRGSGPMSTHQRTIDFLRKFNTPEGEMGDAPSKVEIRRTLSQLDNAARKATGEERKRILATFKEMQQIAVNYGVTYNRRR